MADFNMNDLLKSLPAEMQEKANACKNAEELLQFADENNIELPADALDSVSGGCGSSDSKKKHCCPQCGAEMVERSTGPAGGFLPFYYCTACNITQYE